MALQDTLSQMTWAMMQDWMAKKQQKYALENLAATQAGWTKYQQEGSEQELGRIQAATEAQKQAMLMAKLMGITNESDPQALRTLKIMEAIAPGSTKALMAMIPGMEKGSALITEQVPNVLAGNFGGMDSGALTGAMGGIENFLRLIESGAGLKSIEMQMPTRAKNAQANLDRAGQLPVADRARIAGIDNDLNRLWTNVTDVSKNWTKGGDRTSNFEAMLVGMAQLMPELKGMASQDPEGTKKWVIDVGAEFFESMKGRISKAKSNLRAKADGSALTNGDLQFMAAAGDLYTMAKMFEQAREEVVKARWMAAGGPEGNAPSYSSMLASTPPNLVEQLKKEIKDAAWEMMFPTK